MAEVAGSSERDYGRWRVVPRPRKLSWYPFAPADYRADTRHLSRTEHFAYRETLDEIFLSGQDSDPPSIPDDPDALSDLWRCESEDEYAAMRATLVTSRRAVLVAQDGRISQKRMSAEIAKGRDVSAKRAEAASKRWATRTETARHGEKAEARVGDSGGNGHGPAKMSDKQYLFYAGRVGKWLEQNRDMYAGSNGDAFDAAFKREIGITWKAWRREEEMHQSKQ